MKYLLLLLVCGPVMADITSTRVTSYDWQCQKADGTKISDHTRFDTALIACLNANGSLIQGGRYRIAQTGAPVDPPATGTAALSWTAPTQNTDGSPIAQPVTYKVYHGTAPAALTQVVPVTALAYTFTALPTGTHYFAVTAVTVDGESAQTGVASKVIP